MVHRKGATSAVRWPARDHSGIDGVAGVSSCVGEATRRACFVLAWRGAAHGPRRGPEDDLRGASSRPRWKGRSRRPRGTTSTRRRRRTRMSRCDRPPGGPGRHRAHPDADRDSEGRQPGAGGLIRGRGYGDGTGAGGRPRRAYGVASGRHTFAGAQRQDRPLRGLTRVDGRVAARVHPNHIGPNPPPPRDPTKVAMAACMVPGHRAAWTTGGRR